MLKSPRILRRVQQERLGKLEIRTRFKTIQTTAMLKSPRILRRLAARETRETGDQNKIQDHPDHSNVKITLAIEYLEESKLGKLRTRFKTIQTTAMLKSRVQQERLGKLSRPSSPQQC